MDFPSALKDAEKCLEIDPTFVKCIARKGNIHMLLKEYHKALECFEKGIKLEPDNRDCNEGRTKTMQTISMQAHSGGGHDEERVKRAMADPEI